MDVCWLFFIIYSNILISNLKRASQKYKCPEVLEIREIHIPCLILILQSIELQQRLAEIEEEQAKLKAMRSQLAASFAPRPARLPVYKTISPEEQAEADARSIYVGNVSVGLWFSSD